MTGASWFRACHDTAWVGEGAQEVDESGRTWVSVVWIEQGVQMCTEVGERAQDVAWVRKGV